MYVLWHKCELHTYLSVDDDIFRQLNLSELLCLSEKERTSVLNLVVSQRADVRQIHRWSGWAEIGECKVAKGSECDRSQ